MESIGGVTLAGKLFKLFTITLIVVVWLPHQATADPVDDFNFDIYSRDQLVEVWVDVDQLISESHWSQLEDGGDFAFELNFSLTTPRRLFGDAVVVKNEQAIKLSYHIVTETYYCGFSADQFNDPIGFASVSDLSEYLADSLTFIICEVDKLNQNKKHTLRITITRLSLADLSRFTKNEDKSSINSALEPLFRTFLDLTQFGRKEFTARSRPLSIDELSE